MLNIETINTGMLNNGTLNMYAWKRLQRGTLNSKIPALKHGNAKHERYNTGTLNAGSLNMGISIKTALNMGTLNTGMLCMVKFSMWECTTREC